jgi:hypothetical protein
MLLLLRVWSRVFAGVIAIFARAEEPAAGAGGDIDEVFSPSGLDYILDVMKEQRG